jgi:hypothetical protein
MHSDGGFVPNWSFPGPMWTLKKQIAAFQIFQLEDDAPQLGCIVNLPEGAELLPCSEGFNERTLKVRYEGCFYFVFIQDLEFYSCVIGEA